MKVLLGPIRRMGKLLFPSQGTDIPWMGKMLLGKGHLWIAAVGIICGNVLSAENAVSASGGHSQNGRNPVSIPGDGEHGKNPNAAAWNHLLNNKPDSAEAIFFLNTKSDDPTVRGEGFRGLSEVSAYLGQDIKKAAFTLESFKADKDTALLYAGLLKLYPFGQYPEGYRIKSAYKVLESLAKKPGLFTGEIRDILINRYLNDGSLRKAKKMHKRLGSLTHWKIIGPFENTSNSGWHTVYPPEKELDFSKIYPGKDANKARWTELKSRDTWGWIFMDNHSGATDAIHYLYGNIASKKTQEVILAYGSSSAFKIFLNGQLVLADSVFRNTGADTYMQRVRLHEGGNRLLLKLGHETNSNFNATLKRANFNLRFLDLKYETLDNITVNTELPPPRKAPKPSFSRLNPTPSLDSVTQILKQRIAADSGDIDALLLLTRHYIEKEQLVEGQKLAEHLVKKFPKSALLHTFLAEAMMRDKKQINAENYLKKAFKLHPLNFQAWEYQLSLVTAREDAKALLQFLDKSPDRYRKSTRGLVYTLTANAALKRQAESLEHLQTLEKKHSYNDDALTVLMAFYMRQGKIDRLIDLIESYKKHNRMEESYYNTLASLYLKQGEVRDAMKQYEELAKYAPNNPNSYYQLAYLHYYNKDYEEALEWVEISLSLIPDSPNALLLKANILVSLGDKKAARECLGEVIAFTSSDFKAWDMMRELEGKHPVEELASLPRHDSLIEESRSWSYRDYEKGSIVSMITDIFYYPSHSSSKRKYLLVYLPTEDAVSLWKERTIYYNSNFQTLTINRAISYKNDGSEVEADVNQNSMVFKSLQPGDYLLVEWTLHNYYRGDMANRVYGEHTFDVNFPIYDSRLRLVTPAQDTIAYEVYGDSVFSQKTTVEDYLITEFVRQRYDSKPLEDYMPTDWEGKAKVAFSSFNNWNEIASWYYDLTQGKSLESLELLALTDSLFEGAETDREKVRRVHAYITQDISYSFVPFRQSGWVPQRATDVLSSKIGDCKDMASLGKILLKLGGVSSELVLVNTEARQLPQRAFIGPNFNHCILKVVLDGKDQYIDFTAANFSMNTLPVSDQGAMALVIHKREDSLITLPVDSSSQRSKVRQITSKVDSAGNLAREVQTVRTGVYAGYYRSNFRYLSKEERHKRFHGFIASSFPDFSLEYLEFDGLQHLTDTLHYRYKIVAKNAVSFNANTATIDLELPDRLKSQYYPNNENRNYAIDMHEGWFNLSHQEMKGSLEFPAGWRLIDLPPEVTLESKFGRYQFSFSHNGNTIEYTRTATFNIRGEVSLEEYPDLLSFLNKISQTDAVKLLFYTN